MNNFHLVFVCTGNICRSPMAEGIMKDCILDEIESGEAPLPMRVSSAGTSAVEGFSASEYAVQAAAQHGIDIKSHRSKQLSGSIVESADLMLTMDSAHTAIINQYWPGFETVYELKSYNSDRPLKNPDRTVIDPIGMSLDIYLEVFGEIKREIDRIKQSIFADARDNFAG